MSIIADRYFVVNKDQVKDYKSTLVPDQDYLPLDYLPNSKQLTTLSDGRVIIHCRLGSIQINSMKEIAELEDPLTLEAVQFLGLVGSYVGETREEVLAMFPELDKYEMFIDSETGKEYQRHIFPGHN